MYGPDQFTEEDVLAVATELEKEDPADNDITDAVDDDEDCQKKWCSQCQVGNCNAFIGIIFQCLLLQGSLRVAVVSLVCWHVHCQKCWLTHLVNINSYVTAPLKLDNSGNF